MSSGRVAYSAPGWQGSRGMGGGVCLEQAVTLRKSKKLMSQMVPKADVIWWRFWIPERQVCATLRHWLHWTFSSACLLSPDRYRLLYDMWSTLLLRLQKLGEPDEFDY